MHFLTNTAHAKQPHLCHTTPLPSFDSSRSTVLVPENDKNCFFTIRLADSVETSALLDTGSFHSIFQENFVNSHPQLQRAVKPLSNPTRARAVNDTAVHYSGEITCPITINGNTSTIKAYVSPSICIPVIVGYSFLRAVGVTMKFSKPGKKTPKYQTR